MHFTSFSSLIVLIVCGSSSLVITLCTLRICLDDKDLFVLDMNPLFYRQATHESHTFDYGDYLPAFVQYYKLPNIGF